MSVTRQAQASSCYAYAHQGCQKHAAPLALMGRRTVQPKACLPCHHTKLVKSLKCICCRRCKKITHLFGDAEGSFGTGTIMSLFGAFFQENSLERRQSSDPYCLDPPDSMSVSPSCILYCVLLVTCLLHACYTLVTCLLHVTCLHAVAVLDLVTFNIMPCHNCHEMHRGA